MYDTNSSMGAWAEVGSALCALGVVAVGIANFFSDRRKKLEERINRIAGEVRWIERSSSPPIRPFYEGDL